MTKLDNKCVTGTSKTNQAFALVPSALPWAQERGWGHWLALCDGALLAMITPSPFEHLLLCFAPRVPRLTLLQRAGQTGGLGSSVPGQDELCALSLLCSAQSQSEDGANSPLAHGHRAGAPQGHPWDPAPAWPEQISKGSSVQAIFGALPMEQGWEEHWRVPGGRGCTHTEAVAGNKGEVHCPWEGHTTPQSPSQTKIPCKFSFLFFSVIILWVYDPLFCIHWVSGRWNE